MGNSFYKTSDFADGPTLAATRVRTTSCVPPALQIAPSEHAPLSPYQVICYSFVYPLNMLRSYLRQLIMEKTPQKPPLSLYNQKQVKQK